MTSKVTAARFAKSVLAITTSVGRLYTYQLLLLLVRMVLADQGVLAEEQQPEEAVPDEQEQQVDNRGQVEPVQCSEPGCGHSPHLEAIKGGEETGATNFPRR